MGANFELGAVSVFPVRVLILVGVVRGISRSEFRGFRFTGADRIMLAFGIFCLISSVFHAGVSAAFIFRAGLLMDTWGVYFLFRNWIRSWEEFPFFVTTLLFILIPLACFMSVEKLTGKNLFHYVSGLALEPELREGRSRARGPFRHPIIAGTVAAAWLPLVFALWGTHRKVVLIGSAASFLVVVACASSGPLMTLGAALGALYAWRFRSHLRALLWGAAVGVLLLQLAMQSPIWHIMTKIDLVGGSTGWHRAKLIDSAILYWKEWVIGGTDHTRHWMPSGISWSTDHTDITNNYLKMGVIGGLPMMLAFIALILRSFKTLVSAMRAAPESRTDLHFQFWGLGASLFAHSVSMVGVSYFDQAVLAVFYSLVAMIASLSQSLLLSDQFAPVRVPTAEGLADTAVPTGSYQSSRA
ncbi:MAG: hypothetical protein HYY24_02010 [Verrucomicrobia bacterium]|nr:hypothetical protein [Verrucomicrobiota bacterium]